MTPEQERLTVSWLRRAACEDLDEIHAVLLELQQRLLELQHRISLLPTEQVCRPTDPTETP